MAGTIPISMTQQLDIYGQPLSGGRLYGIQAATVSTPQNFFQDFALTLPWPNPITLDAAGRIPQLYCADGTIKIRLTDAAGVTQVVADNITVIGPSSGGGGGGTVDPTTIYQTGDLKSRYGTGAHTGWVRANGLTIGSSTSGATEPGGNIAAAQALFIYLWGVDSSLTVSGGRGSTALADWTANKQLTLPDLRGRVIAGMDDMGNTIASRISSIVFSTTLGGTNSAAITAGNDQTRALVTANLPAYTPAGTIGNGIITSTFSPAAGQVLLNNTKPGSAAYFGGSLLAELLAGTVSSTQAASTFTGTAQGGVSTPFSIVQPTMVCTFYLKL